MKRVWLTVVLALWLPLLYAQEKSELRAVWLTNVDSNVLSSDQNISDAMDYLASMGVNVVFPVVYNKGYTLYPSRIMDSLFHAPVLPGSPFVGRDFLPRMVIEAHRNGIEVIPWFEFGFSTSYSLSGGHIIAQFPAWALKNASGTLVTKNGFDWMSAINPDAQRFMMSLLMEVLDNYDVDGVQGDDRLPAMPVEGGYDSVTVQIYKSEHAGQAPPSNSVDAAWMRWRADKLTNFLSRLRDSVKARGSHTILSVAPTPYSWGYPQYLQDSKTWSQQGLVDNLIPQLYQYTIGDFTSALNTTWNDVGQYHPAVFASGILANVGTYVVDTVLLGQMLTATRAKGVKGECLFFYEGLRMNNNRIGNFLRAQFYQIPAVPPYRNGQRWIPKAHIVNETDDAAVKSGAWSVYPMKGYQGAIYRTDDTMHYTAIRYNVVVDNSAYYDVYSFKTPNTPWTKQASYTLYGDNDSVAVSVDQSDLAQKGWCKIGTVFLSQGTRLVLKLDNTGLMSGEYLVADAVMIMLNRKRSPDVLVSVAGDAAVRLTTPYTLELANNYPNPFNPGTTIGFSVWGPWSGKTGTGDWALGTTHVRLSVYDLLGREVAVLVNEQKEPGNYVARFDGSGFASGVYVYRLTAGGYSRTRTMVLLK